MEPTDTPDFAAHARRTLALLDEAGCPQAPTREAVAWLDAALDRSPVSEDGADRARGLAPRLDADGIGAVLGEAIAAETGGAWRYHAVQHDWGVRLPSGETAFPLQRARRHASGEPGASILALFDTVAAMH